jgi:hypothetical protein
MEVNLPENMEKLLYAMVPMYGESPTDVLAFIVTAYLHDNSENILNMTDLNEMLERSRCGCQCDPH